MDDISPTYWPRICQHKTTQRCLYTEERWWHVCQSCGAVSDHTSKLVEPRWQWISWEAKATL